MKKILILGASGQLGHRLFLDLRKKHSVIGTVRQYPKAFGLFGVEAADLIAELDVIDFNAIDRIANIHQPDVMINCVGYIKQRGAVDRESMMAINGHFPQKLGAYCRQNNIYLIHFSTDCVFSGKKGNYRETDEADANDIYGLSKHFGEIRDNPHCLTLRTSIIGRELVNNIGLLEWFFQQPAGHQINGFTRAIWSGFPTHRISGIVDTIISLEDPLIGLYHLASGPISKYELLRLVNEKFNRGVKINPVDEPQIDRSLDGSRLANKIGNTALELPQLIDDLQIDFDKYEILKSSG